ncbi:hypothetical protein [Ilumatobacter sp.]|uniref:hypothetical protein n=1 Tax=Ilumatobacter sp. TaxID=1967498 RepID=UPI003B529FA9
MAAAGRPAPPGSLTLHSSLTAYVATLIGAASLVAIAVVVVAVNGATIPSVVLAVAACAAAGYVAWSVPLATAFDERGATRRTLVRRHLVEWGDVDELTRLTRRSVARRSSSSSVGLAARVGGRTLLLVDRTEGSAEHARLRSIASAHLSSERIDDLDPPPPERTPTWVGRRRRWRPEGA